MKYNEKLKEVREDNDLTQTDIAKILGTTQQQIYKYENGIQEMTVSRLRDYCLALNISADYILGLPKDIKRPR